MQTLHFYQTIVNQELNLKLPVEFAGKMVEVIVSIHNQLTNPLRKERIQKFRGILKGRKTYSEIDQFIKNLRSEWENSI